MNNGLKITGNIARIQRRWFIQILRFLKCHLQLLGLLKLLVYSSSWASNMQEINIGIKISNREELGVLRLS